MPFPDAPMVDLSNDNCLNSSIDDVFKSHSLLPSGLPCFPDDFIDQDETLSLCLKRILSCPPGSVVTITESSNKFGTGKTAFASAVVRSTSSKFFQSGIFWVNVGNIRTDQEIIGVFRVLAETLLDHFFGLSILTPHQYERWQGVLRPTRGDVNIDDCTLCVRSLLGNSASDTYGLVSRTALASSSNPHKVLIILDDLWSDRILRLLRGIDATFLITTSWPELFSEGQYPGSVFSLATFSPPQPITPTFYSAADSLVSLCSTWLEVSALRSAITLLKGTLEEKIIMISERFKSITDLSSPMSQWIVRHKLAHWARVPILPHLSTFAMLSLAFDSLDNELYQYSYMCLCLLPCTVLLSPVLLMRVWSLPSHHAAKAIASEFVQRHLLNSVLVGDTVHYQISPIHSQLMLMLSLRSIDLPPESSWLPGLGLGSLFSALSPRSPSPHRLHNLLDITASRIIAYLVDRVRISSTPLYLQHTEISYWRQLHTCEGAGLLPQFEGVAGSFERVILACKEEGDLPAFIAYATPASFIVELVCEEEDVSQGERLKDWYSSILDGLGVLGKNFSQPSRETWKGSVMNKLGRLYRKEGKYAEALDLHLKALDIYQSLRHPSGGALHGEIASTFSDIASIYIAEGAYSDAIHVIRTIIKFQEGLSGYGQVMTVGEAWMQLGDAYESQGDHDEAIRCYSTAICTFLPVYGGSHPQSMLAEGLKGISLMRRAKKWRNPATHQNVGARQGDGNFAGPELDSSSYSLRDSDGNDGVSLLSGAISFFIRRGESNRSVGLHRLLAALPEHERLIFESELTFRLSSEPPRRAHDTIPFFLCGIFPCGAEAKTIQYDE
jgi:tetratricopeptide (TPR) repeat protein